VDAICLVGQQHLADRHRLYRSGDFYRPDADAKDTSTTNSYIWREGAQQSSIQFKPDVASGTTYTTNFYYDAAGRLTSAYISDGRPRSVTFRIDENGQILIAAVAVAVTALAPFGSGAIVANAIAGNVAGQAVGIASGAQDGFSFKSMAMTAITAGVAPGAGKLTPGSIGGSTFAADVLRGAVTNGIGQGVAVATGLQSRFDWAGVATAGIGQGVGAGVSRELASQNGLAGMHASVGSFGNTFGATMASTIANAATRSAVSGTSFGDNLMRALPDAIGQTLGRSLGSALAKASRPADLLANTPYGSGGDATAPGLESASANSSALGNPVGRGTFTAGELAEAIIKQGDSVSFAGFGVPEPQARYSAMVEADQDGLITVKGYRSAVTDIPFWNFGMGGEAASISSAEPSTFLGQVYAGAKYAFGKANIELAGTPDFVGMNGFQIVSRTLSGGLRAGINHLYPDHSSLATQAIIEGHNTSNPFYRHIASPSEMNGLRAWAAEGILTGMTGSVRSLFARELLPIETVYQARYASAYERGLAKVEADLVAGKVKAPFGQPEHLFKANQVDAFARADLKAFALEQGHGADLVRINQRLYLDGVSGAYRVPDLYFPQSRTIFDGTLGVKTLNTRQIVDFRIATGNAPIGIVRPQSYGGSYWLGN
jgi:hypothetical protein